MRVAVITEGFRPLTFRLVDMKDEYYLDPQAMAATVERVQAYVRREPGAWSSLAEATRSDPEGTTRSLLALGTVLLDIAAGAFSLAPEEVLEKVARSLDDDGGDQLTKMAQQ